MSSPPQTSPKFDAYADNYDTLAQQSLGTSGEDPEYFRRYKVDCLKRFQAEGPVLDYGCGIGNLTRHLARWHREVHGCDPSSESLRVARERVPDAHFFAPQELPHTRHYGSVVIAGVMHHIPVEQRNLVLTDIRNRLRPGGRVFVFEHNPLNPLTQKSVRDCAFDDDAVLLSAREVTRRLKETGFTDVRLDYIVFFPRILRWLRPLEPKLRRVILGAQTLTVGTAP